jgi:large subunit ribosomal protein L10
MIVDRVKKEAVVSELDQIFTDSGIVVVAHYTGLTVADMSDLRLRMRKIGGAVRVAKNKLVKIALKGKDCESVSSLFSGQTVLIYSEDQVAAAKVAVEFSKDNEKLVVLGGSMGATSLDSNGITQVAKMPSRDEVIGAIANILGSPAANISNVIGSPGSTVASIIATLEGEKAA